MEENTALARALIIHPKVLLMDEPLSALDRKTREELIQEFRRIHKKFDITIIQVTHNFDEALQLADRIAILKKGKISQVGTTDEIFRHPKDKFVADFVGSENIINGIAKEGIDGLTIVDTGNIKIESSQKKIGDVHLTISPEDITLSNENIVTSARNVFKGYIKEIYDLGTIIKLTVDVGEQLILVLTRKSFSDLELNIGKEIYIYFKATAVNLF